jgi:hypothetical protein
VGVSSVSSPALRRPALGKNKYNTKAKMSIVVAARAG